MNTKKRRNKPHKLDPCWASNQWTNTPQRGILEFVPLNRWCANSEGRNQSPACAATSRTPNSTELRPKLAGANFIGIQSSYSHNHDRYRLFSLTTSDETQLPVYKTSLGPNQMVFYIICTWHLDVRNSTSPAVAITDTDSSLTRYYVCYS